MLHYKLSYLVYYKGCNDWVYCRSFPTLKKASEFAEYLKYNYKHIVMIRTYKHFAFGSEIVKEVIL